MFEGLFQPTQIGAGLGKSIRDFKKAIAGVSDDLPGAALAKRLPAAPANPEVSAGDTPEPKQS
ncbi:MAG: hypothetical protein AUG04_07325 [Deltaproteobacteria bacterium 13_1_20CM_2_69_21]|nr:MAG: hypothetical protein AUG04_07325 [Deltaproteobacteria bacterium 13_1_20CM_2_69_21]